MDYSEKYVQMCEKAEEIQDCYFDVEDFRPMLPSFLYDKRMGKVSIHIWTPPKLQDELGFEQAQLSISTEWAKPIGVAPLSI